MLDDMQLKTYIPQTDYCINCFLSYAFQSLFYLDAETSLQCCILALLLAVAVSMSMKRYW